MAKLPFVTLAGICALVATATAAEPSAAVLTTARLNTPSDGPVIGQARSLRSLSVATYRLGF